MKYKVYWIYNDSEKDPCNEGYIGITHRPLSQRLKEHRKRNSYRFHSNDKIKVLESFTTSEEASAREAELRPEKYIGRNYAIGGIGGSGVDKTDDHKEKIGSGKQSWWDSPESDVWRKELSNTMKGNNIQGPAHNKMACVIDGQEYDSVRGAAEIVGIPHNTIRYRIRKESFPSYHYK